MKRIIYQNDTGGVAIMEALNPNLTIEEVAAKDVPDGVPYEIIDVADIPKNSEFRNAWRKNGKAIETDIPAARAIAHDKRRADRDKRMAPLDLKATIPAEAVKAESARTKVRAENSKIQADIDAAGSETALLAIMATLSA